jgi:hypothetical protein
MGPLPLEDADHQAEHRSMNVDSDQNVNPLTPWEFLPDDDQSRAPIVTAEEAAMHVEVTGERLMSETEDEPLVVHYLDDEATEVVDRTIAEAPIDSTATVADLLTRQHYLPPTFD